MALTISSVIDRGERTFPQQHGLRLKQVDVTLGVATTDYSSGVDISGNAAKFGMTKVFAVLEAGVRASSGTVKAYVDQYNYDTGKLQLFVPDIAATSATNLALAEIVASDHLANGDIVRMVIIGV
jgi:hypothetical protein